MWRSGKRFPCPDCHKTFATQVDLKAHLMRHITQHPYVCFACGKGFKYDHTLDFHIKSQHGAENGASSGGAGGSGNNNTGPNNGKNEQYNLKCLNRKGCKVKREMPEEKASLFGSSGVAGRRLGSQLEASVAPDDLIVNVNHNNVPNNKNNHSHNTSCTSGKANSDHDRLVSGEISSDLRHHLSTNPLPLTGLNLSSGPSGLGLLEPSILNGLKFSLSSYPSASSSNSSHSSSSKSNNQTVPPIVPPPILPSSSVSSSCSLISAPIASTSLASPLLTTTTQPSSSLVSSLTLSSSSSTPTSSISKEKLMNASQIPLIDFGDVLSPRNLQIKSEKVLISILEGVHPINEQLYSLYKCCLCGFAFPSLEPVSIHIQSMHSNNLNLTCDKCGATFKWKSELQLHEQLHKVMDQSTNNINTSSNKCKSQLQSPHHSQSLSDQQHNHHLLQHQQQSRSLVMSSFLQPNLVFMNPYLNVDQQLLAKGSEGAKRSSVKMESGEESNGRDDDSQGLNLCLKRKHKTEIRDANNNNDNNMMRHNGINYDNENNINNCNAHDNNNQSNNNSGHDGISSMIMDEPIDLKVESLFADSNNNINNISPINPLSFLHSSLLPQSVGLPFPPSSQLTSAAAAAAAAAAFAAGISSQQHQPQHSKNKQLHQHFQSIASMVSGISTTLTTTTSGSSSISGSGPGIGTGSGSVSSSSSSGSVNGNGTGGGFSNAGEGAIGGGKAREPIGDIEETAPGQFKCRYCEKTFDRIFSVHRHERVHTGYKPCICRVCGRGFSEKRNLRHHIIRFHSDGSGRELLKRVRKEKSMSAASFLKKAAVRILSNSSLEASAIEEENIMKKQSDTNNNSEVDHAVGEIREEKEFDREPRFRSDEVTDANVSSKAGNLESNNNEPNPKDEKEMGLEANGECNMEDGDKVCANFSSCSSSSSSRRKSKPSKKITHLESGDRSEDESELSEKVASQGERKNDYDEKGERQYEDENEERGGGEAGDDGEEDRDKFAEEEEEEEEEENRDSAIVDDFCDPGDDSNEQKMDAANRLEDDTNTCKNDLNGSLDENKCSQESKLRLHGAFFSNYSPRLALVDKVLKRSKQSKPLIGPDGRYLYPCDHCQKTFCSSSDLNRHIGFHENIRPFKCEFCDYQSRTNSQLKVHVMRHAGIKQYLCHTCNYNGVTQSDLNRHRKTQSHKSRSGNICSICSLGFSTPTLLDDHISKFHETHNTPNNKDKNGPVVGQQESKNGSSSPSSSSSPSTTSSSMLLKAGPAASTSTTTSPPPPMPSTINTDKVLINEMDSNNNIEVNLNNVLGLNANRFSVNNLL